MSFITRTDKGNLFIGYTRWGVSIVVRNDAGETVDSWDGRLQDVPARFAGYVK